MEVRMNKEYLQFTEFRNNAKKYFDNLKKGFHYIIVRRGQPIAELSPVNKPKQGWKRKIDRIKLNKEVSVSEMIEEERNQK